MGVIEVDFVFLHCWLSLTSVHAGSRASDKPCLESHLSLMRQDNQCSFPNALVDAI